MHFSDVECGKRLFLGTGRPIALGVGEDEIRGSAYLEGPIQMGTADAFTTVLGTLMIAREKNDDDKNQQTFKSMYISADTLYKVTKSNPILREYKENIEKYINEDTK